MITQQSHRKWLALVSDPRMRTGAAAAGYALAGLILSGGALAGAAQPLSMGLVCALTGWRALAAALGSLLGFRIFWAGAGIQGMVWTAGGCIAALLLGKHRSIREAPLLLPALAAFWVSVVGLAFQVLLADETPVGVYLLRVALAGGSTALYALARQRSEPLAEDAAAATAVLALCRASPLALGAAGFLGAAGSFPAAALAGLALDIGRVTAVPMTGVLCLGYLGRLLPRERKWLRFLAPAAGYLAVMLLSGEQALAPLPPLLIGGAVGLLLPEESEPRHRKGETALAQVRLEIMSGVLNQTRQLLLEVPETPIDEDALLARTRERACGSCPVRKTCADREKLDARLLHEPLTDTACVPCRKPSRMLTELRRSQEQLRGMGAERKRRGECRRAVMQQYQFLGEFLRALSDELPRKGSKVDICFRVDAEIVTCGKESENGDACQYFDGPGGCFYILLCDGMGTGMGAAQEARTAMTMLKKMLTAGFPAEHALRSVNSLCCLRGRAGAVTVDLTRIELDTGKTAIYKWGAAPSYLLSGDRAEKIGTAGPPPGLMVEKSRETVDRLSLRRGEVLILMSDGVDGEEVLRQTRIDPGQPLGEIAAKLLEGGWKSGADDATVAAVRLHPST